MLKPPRLDLRRLERELVLAADARGPKLAPGGRPVTGLMALVRENLDALVALQAGGSTWKEIAAGLTAQGYKTADGRPLTDTDLTGVISSVRRQAKRDAARAATRQSRLDLPQRAPHGPERRLSLSADLVSSASSHDPPAIDASASEEAIRRENLDKLQDLLKPSLSKKD
ncbi:hypothetical protein G3T14_21100 [Methylobacterium sp. BTF04]|uniref:hypothetical protein n=1 Tax=Methylobacterium sp. BTF04 TaxID=2708300 RepID=UPI0013D3459E|nr:hypothetical protein [Methylobacterium sp. BTF04]NEU14590.1 hypothetical protein [Methylobacterium sp. BTF04]